MSRGMLVPGPSHPVTIEPTGRRVLVRAGAQVLVDTTRALTLRESTYPPVQYLPLTDVDETLLRSTRKVTYCPYKGRCSYFTVVTERGDIPNAVWTYPHPYAAVAEIAGHVACYPGRLEVTVLDAPADPTPSSPR